MAHFAFFHAWPTFCKLISFAFSRMAQFFSGLVCNRIVAELAWGLASVRPNAHKKVLKLLAKSLKKFLKV